MTPEDEKRLAEIRVHLRNDGYLNSFPVTQLIAIIDDLRGELHGYQAAAEEEARAVDEQVATSYEHRERCEAWERRALAWEVRTRELERGIGEVVAELDSDSLEALREGDKRRCGCAHYFSFRLTDLMKRVSDAHHPAPEPKGA